MQAKPPPLGQRTAVVGSGIEKPIIACDGRQGQRREWTEGHFEKTREHRKGAASIICLSFSLGYLSVRLKTPHLLSVMTPFTRMAVPPPQ